MNQAGRTPPYRAASAHFKWCVT